MRSNNPIQKKTTKFLYIKKKYDENNEKKKKISKKKQKRCQHALTFQACDLNYQTKRNLSGKNHEARFSINQMLKDEIEKKISIIQ